MSYCLCCKDEIGCLPSVLIGCVTVRAAKGSGRFMVMLNCRDAIPLLRKEVTKSRGREPLQGLLGLQPDSDLTQSSCCLPPTPAFSPAAERKLLKRQATISHAFLLSVLRRAQIHGKGESQQRGRQGSLSGGASYWLLFSGLASGLVAAAVSRLPLHCSECKGRGLKRQELFPAAAALPCCGCALLIEVMRMPNDEDGFLLGLSQ